MSSSGRNVENIVQEAPKQLRGTLKNGQHRKGNSQTALLAISILAVATLVLVTHWPALSTRALTSDDNQYLTENQLVQNPGWSSAARFLSEILEPSTVKGYYQPLTMISLMADYAIAGRADNLRPFHRTSLCLHVMNTALVIVFLYMLFGQVWGAAMVGLLFGIHPMCVEPIAWVGERKTLLAMFFVLLSLICYVRYTRKNSWMAYITSLVTFVLALMSKPTSTPLPLLLLLLDYWPLNRRALLEKLPFFVVGGISAVITLISQTRTLGAVMLTKHYPTAVPLVLCHNIRFYLHKIVWPVNLSMHYPFPKPMALSQPAVFGGLVTTAVLIVVLLLSLRHTRALLVGFLFFFVAILPTEQIIGFSDVIAANKFAYLPSLGLLLPLTWFLGRFWNGTSRTVRQTAKQVAIVFLVAILVFGEACAARSYLSHWIDTETLYRYMLTLTPDVPSLRFGLGGGLLEKGRIDEAIEMYRKEPLTGSDSYKTLNNLAAALVMKGETAEAVEYLGKAVQLKPDDFKSHYNLGVMLSEQSRFDEAIKHFRQAVRIRPDDANAHYNLGVLLGYQGHTDEAIGQYRAALQSKPDFPEAQAALNAALAQKQAVPAR